MGVSTVLVTRPAGQEVPLCAALQKLGYKVCHQPLIELQALDDIGPAARSMIEQLERYQHIIFISANAVRFGMDYLADYWPQWPLGGYWYSVGSGTARALAHWDVTALTPAAGEMTSEGLLRLPSLSVLAGQRVLIVKGEGGRDLLHKQMEQLGAQVDQLVCYRRLPVVLAPGELAVRLRQWQVNAILLSSGQGLDSLLTLISREESTNLGEITLLVPSQRVAAQARAAGFERLLVADNASDGAMLQAMERWHQISGDRK